MHSGKKMTPEQDGRFQKILSMFLAAAAGPRNEAMRKTRGGHLVSTVNNLFELRLQFEVTNIQYVSYTNEDRMAAYQAYRAMRDSPEGYFYIQANPDYFTETHHALCRVAVDVKEARA